MIGDRVTVKNAVLVWDGVTVEDDVFLGPNVRVHQRPAPARAREEGPGSLLPTLVRRGATLGAGATVVCGTTIGEYAFVAAGAVVTARRAGARAGGGQPGRVVGWVCRCGERLDERAALHLRSAITGSSDRL